MYCDCYIEIYGILQRTKKTVMTTKVREKCVETKPHHIFYIGKQQVETSQLVVYIFPFDELRCGSDRRY
jgi:hypothetical protein